MSGTFSRFSKARIPAAQIVKCCQIGPGIISFRRECGDSSITLPRVCPATKVIFVVLKSHPAWVGLFFYRAGHSRRANHWRASIG
jgi:hypothetical protein